MTDPVTYVPYLHPADEESDLCACSACGAYTWVKRVTKPIDPECHPPLNACGAPGQVLNGG